MATEMNPNGPEIYEHGYGMSAGAHESLPHEGKKGTGLFSTIKENVKTFTDAVTGNAKPEDGDEYLPANDAAALQHEDRAAPREAHQEMRQERNESGGKGEQPEDSVHKSCLGLSCHTAQ